jgi:long-chain acyl-CoA synthetase
MTPPKTYRPLLLSGGLHASAERSPRKAALICQDLTRSYAELADRVRRVCGGALALGLQRGDRVAVFAPNCIEYPELVCGLSDAGGIVATVNGRATTRELEDLLRDCGARLLVVHPSLAAVASAARVPSLERTLVLGAEYEAWLAAATPSLPLESIAETDPFTLVYSSGTTGKPKGIVISHRSRTLTFHAMAMEYGCYGPDDLQLGLAPMAHGAGFAFIMASLYFGGTVEVLPRFDPQRVVEKLAREPFTGVFMVPTHFQSIFGLERAVLDAHRGQARALRTIMSNAAALPQAVKEKIVAYWGEGLLHETYGSTEAGIVTNLRPADQLRRRQSVGPAFALNQVRLLDAQGREVPRGEVGELHSRSPYLFNGYWNKPDETAASLKDGWVTAGDLARQDDDGCYYIVDRKKDMVVTGGFNVYPREIEEVLHEHPAVGEAAVIGRPDDYFGEALRAYIVFRSGATASAAELETHCRAVLAGYKVPKEFLTIDALPRNTGGKVLKTALRRD